MNGIRAVIKDGTFGTFMEKAAPKVLCLNETKIDSHALEKDGVISHLSKWFPRGLQFWNCCKNKKGYSGTAILIADDFEGGKPSKVEYDFGKPGEHDQEGRVVTAYFDKFTLVASYVPNSGVIDLGRLDYRVKQWDKDLQTFLKDDLGKLGKPVIWCGDLNVAHHEIDIYNPKGKDRCAGFTKEERESFGAFLKEGFIDSYRHLHPGQTKFSYWNVRSGARAKGQGWRLDYFVVSKNILDSTEVRLVDSCINNEMDGSDHCPISLKLEVKH